MAYFVWVIHLAGGDMKLKNIEDGMTGHMILVVNGEVCESDNHILAFANVY